MPDFYYTTPIEGTEVGEAVPIPMDEVDTALIATNPDNRGPEPAALFEDIDTDKIEAFPETARMVAAAEMAAKWEVIGTCHDAMTEAGIPLAQASDIMAKVVATIGVVPTSAPAHRGPRGTLRPHGNAPHAPSDFPALRAVTGHNGHPCKCDVEDFGMGHASDCPAAVRTTITYSRPNEK